MKDNKDCICTHSHPHPLKKILGNICRRQYTMNWRQSFKKLGWEKVLYTEYKWTEFWYLTEPQRATILPYYYKLKSIHDLVRKLNTVDENTLEYTYGVFSYFVRKLTNYFFITINEQLLLIQNMVDSHELKKGKVYKTVCNYVYKFVWISTLQWNSVEYFQDKKIPT